MLLARDQNIMGELRSGPVLAVIGWFVTAVLALLSVALVLSQVLGL
jgi:Mn2+/Fe2+ NRAMP family transporter